MMLIRPWILGVVIFSFLFSGFASKVFFPELLKPFDVQQASAAWYDSSWSYRATVTIDKTKVSGTAALADFPVLVAATTTAWKHTSFSGHVGIASGTDILFTSSDGTTKLSHEIEKYSSSTGELVAWVKVPSLATSTDTVLYLYYGNASAADQSSSTGVWDTNYKGVWHLKDNPAGTAPQLRDSTSNAHHLTTVGSMVSGDQLSAKMNGGVNFDGSNDRGDSSASTLDMNTSVTVTAWLKADTLAGGVHKKVFIHGDRFDTPYIEYSTTVSNNNKVLLSLSIAGTLNNHEGNTTLSTATWYYFGATWDGSNVRLYLNGAQDNTTTARTGSLNDLNSTSSIGGSHQWGEYFDGVFDEVRVSSVARTSGWIATEYNNQSSPSTFTTFGGEEAGTTAYTQSAFRWFENVNATSVGAALAALNTSTTLTAASSSFRLRMLLHVANATSTAGTDTFKLQMATSTPGGCDTSFSGETYADVATSSGAIRFNNNAAPADGTLLAASSSDPTHGGDTVVNQTYEEANNFVVTSTISAGQDGKWDFSLVDASASAGATYCFRAVYSSSTVLGTYSMVPEVTMFTPPVFTQSAYDWFENVNATSVGARISGSAVSWYSSSWSYRATVTIDKTKVSGTAALADFPVLVAATTTAWKDTVNGGHVGIASGTDILFTSSDGTTKLSHEIEKYSSSTGELVAWVKVPSLATSTDTVLYLYYGNTTTTAQASSTGVWDTNYKGVWHLPNGTTLTASDSTSNANNGTLQSAPTATSGQIDGSGSFTSASSQYISTANSLASSQDFTISTWFKTSTAGGTRIIGFESGQTGTTSSNYDRHIYMGTDGKIRFGWWSGAANIVSSTATLTDGLWHHAVGTHTAGNVGTLYIDGVSQGTGGNTAQDYNGYWRIGSYKLNSWAAGADGYFTGQVDEARVSNIARNGGWIKTEYNNQSSPSTFTTFGSEELAAVAPAQGTPFRLRMLLHVASNALSTSGQDFKLQFVGKGTGTCASPTGGTPSSYTDLATASGVIRYYDNAAPADGALLAASSSDPTHGGDTVVNQTYEEANNFTNSQAAISAGQDGKWDFALVDNSAPTSTAFCFRAVKSDGTALDTYSVYPMITTSSSIPIFTPTVSNVVLNGGSAITLTENTSTTISVTATVTDVNGYADISYATSVIYRTGVTAACTADQNNCYRIASSSCPLSSCSGNSCTATCTTKLQYFTESTDDYGAYTQEDWRASVSGVDVGGLAGTATTSSGIELNSLLALDVTSSIDYGTLDANADTGSSNRKTTVVNTGNIPIDPDVSGTNLTSGAYSITAGQQKFSSSTFTYSSCTTCTALATTATSTDIALPRASSTSAWSYRMAITIDKTKVSGTVALADFPVLIAATTTAWKHTSFSGNVGVASGTDIYFTQSDGFTKLDHEIEKYSSSTGELVAWVRVPSLATSTDTVLYMYYGNASSTDQQNKTGVWDDNYVLVHHHEEQNAATTTDSTSKGNNGTSTGTGIPTATTTGKINGTIDFDGTTDLIDVQDSNSLDLTTNVTLSAWVNPTTLANTVMRVAGKIHTSCSSPYDAYSLGKTDATNNWTFDVGIDGTRYRIASPATITTNAWTYLTGVYDGVNMRIYENGVLSNSVGQAGNIGINTAPFRIGRDSCGGSAAYFPGRIDEIRLSSTTRSAAWILTEYNNQNSPSTFTTFGSEQSNTQNNTATADLRWGLAVPNGTVPGAYTGTNTFTAVSQINVGKTWTQATSSANWAVRYGHAALTYKNKLWVLGGISGFDFLNDVWYSTDGITWTQATSSANWGNRSYFQALVYDERMWVMGGTGGTVKNDVWYSTDGITWTQATSSANWAARQFFGATTFNGKMWVMGGTGGTVKNDVWYSTDGITWTQATSSANWAARNAFSSAVYNSKMWVFGGATSTEANWVNDVWYSTDGITWTQATSSANWAARERYVSYTFNNKVWVTGGYTGSAKNDVWYSTDGITWTQATSSANWAARYMSAGAVYRDQLWILGGLADTTKNDVWYSSP
ncbi:MAG: DUF2341 domain-containing protein [bacterium]|nr:DUF2341 domain-containing protein [bacterium]